MFLQNSNFYSYTKPEYLDANRRGEITPEQAQLLGPARKFLTAKFQRRARPSGMVVIAALVLLGAAQLIGIEITTPMVMAALGLILVVLAAQLASRRFASRRQDNRLEEDLQRGEVRNAVGTLRHTGKTYQAVAADQTLTLPFGGREELAPGANYRFYYLPTSGIVLSAEPVDDLPGDAVENGLTQVLAEANGFKLSALPANRRGELAGEQISRLYSSLLGPVIFLAVPGGILYYQLRQGGYLRGNSISGLISSLRNDLTTGLMIAGGILLAAALTGLVLLILTVMDMLGRSVRVVEGVGYRKINTSTDEDGSRTTRLYYVIESERFRVQRPGFNVFEDGLTYRAYYTPLRKVLVNIEVVE